MAGSRRTSTHRWGARLASLSVGAVALVTAGCSLLGSSAADDTDGPRVVQPGAPGEPTRELTEDEIAELSDLTIEHSPADVEFMQGMIAHHVQALRMTRMVPSRSDREDIHLLAKRMDISQEAEIEVMVEWLEARDEPAPSLLASLDGHDHDGADPLDGELMPGMLTADQLAELEAATGEEFDRLFLEYMIFHHRGALAMVHELFQRDGGMEPSVNQFANHVYADQEIEIARMEALLAELADDS